MYKQKAQGWLKHLQTMSMDAEQYKNELMDQNRVKDRMVFKLDLTRV